jgi:uncharacterized protein YjhX (UPF0386 family)
MTKLFSLFVIFFSVNNFAYAGNEMLHLEKLQSLVIVMRIPEQVCKEAADLQPYLSSEGHLAYDETLTALKEDLKRPMASRKFFSRAGNCLKDCTCQVFEDLSDLFPKSQSKVLQTVKSQAASMTDQDFMSCQKKLKLACSSKNIQQALTEAKKAKAEQNP